MPTAYLTHALVDSLDADSVDEGRDYQTWWDTPPEDSERRSGAVQGFGVRVSGRTGRRVFVCRYRASGKRRRVTLGPFPALSLADARAKAKATLYDAATGGDPAAGPAGGELTFQELAERYIERSAKPNVSEGRVKAIQRAMKRDVYPRIGSLPAHEVGRREVAEILDAIVDRGSPIMANRTRSMLSVIFKWGLRRELVEDNPALKVEEPANETPRQRVLEEDEIKLLWHAITSECAPVSGSVLRLRLITGQRGTEIRKMRKGNLKGRWWIIPPEDHKANRRHEVPLSDQAKAVLDYLRPFNRDSEWVLASRMGGHLKQDWGALGRVKDVLPFEFQARDLRRTAATHMTRMGIPRIHVAKVLGHSIPGITGVYDRSSYREEKREALERWGERLEGIVEEVVPEHG